MFKHCTKFKRIWYQFWLALVSIWVLYFLIIPLVWTFYTHGKIIVDIKTGHRQLVDYVVPYPDRHLYIYVVKGGLRLNTEEWYAEHPSIIEAERETLYEGYRYWDEVNVE